MNNHLIIHIDHSPFPHDAVVLLANELHLEEEALDAHLYTLWIEENQTRWSSLEVLQQLEDWFDRLEQKIVWQDARIVLPIVHRGINVLALRTVRAWFVLKSNQIPSLWWFPLEAFDEAYRTWVERNTHPGSVALEIAPLEAIVDPDDDRLVMKKKYTVALVAEAFVTGTLSVEVHPTCSRSEIEHIAKGQSASVTWCYDGTIDGTVRVESIKQSGDRSE